MNALPSYAYGDPLEVAAINERKRSALAARRNDPKRILRMQRLRRRQLARALAK
jgi:hypothetical protein